MTRLAYVVLVVLVNLFIALVVGLTLACALRGCATPLPLPETDDAGVRP